MDPRKYMVIDTLKIGTDEMFITSSVSHLKFNDGMYHITFTSSPKTYKYRYERIKILEKPKLINVENNGFYLRNRLIEDIQELYQFRDKSHYYYHIIFRNGAWLDCNMRDVYISRTSLENCNGNTWKYLNHLADEIGLDMEGVGNILKMQYDIIDKKRDNVPLSQFLNNKLKFNKFNKPSLILYPFGCNTSQKQGVENALMHQMSIIQGPPGTGKTQTILNIIANLLIMGKSVLVVSNNNSAVENVAEKLSDNSIGLGFLVAQLGNRENKELFFENQPTLPQMSSWILPEYSNIVQRVNNTLQVVSNCFEKQTILAKLKVDLDALRVEAHYETLQTLNTFLDDIWLRQKPSQQLIALKCNLETIIEQQKSPNKFFRLKWAFRLGFKIYSLLRKPVNEILKEIELAFYIARTNELETGIKNCEKYLNSYDINSNLKTLQDLSLQVLKHKIAMRRNNSNRAIFTIKDIKPRTEEFLAEYPVVLSTTYAAKNCISSRNVFDYLIMDEASQVDITTGALALSCAENAVIVGDDKQLPNVIDNLTKKTLTRIEEAYQVDDKYRSTTHSFLQSCCDVFTDVPQTLLREHYRCHPKIIEFCNKMFYDNQLIPMTVDSGENDVLVIIRTVKGQHARGHFNQREIDVIQTEVMPKLICDDSVGIITPYRKQSQEINRQFNTDIASTVHKYQGRECNCIVMSMVDNELSEFSDDPNLLNVAISRAKSKLFVVTNGNSIEARSNLGQLIAYANYNNFEVSHSRIHSVFDLLYKQYTEERLAFISSKRKNLGELSENLIYYALQNCIKKLHLTNIDILCHYPLFRLIQDDSILTTEQKLFVHNQLSHVDFLLYNTITKQPLLCFEVDGWRFHQTDVQQKRDEIKDSILDKYSLKPIRISTIQAITEETLLPYFRNF